MRTITFMLAQAQCTAIWPVVGPMAPKARRMEFVMGSLFDGPHHIPAQWNEVLWRCCHSECAAIDAGVFVP